MQSIIYLSFVLFSLNSPCNVVYSLGSWVDESAARVWHSDSFIQQSCSSVFSPGVQIPPRKAVFEASRHYASMYKKTHNS